MNLECLNTIIVDNLAINIDLTDVRSWNLNSNLITYSIDKWKNAIVDLVELPDFGLTQFDNGRFTTMWNGMTYGQNETYFTMYRIGYNTVFNPTTGVTTGMTIVRTILPISGITATTGNYYDLNGGYLQGFFKLHEYTYELFPARYNAGITIETILNIQSNSEGIFYYMGTRAADKYAPYFSGETITGMTTTGLVIDGVNTSEGNYLNAIQGKTVYKRAFSSPEDNKEIIYFQPEQINNIKNNVIAFELTANKELGYRYLDVNGQYVRNVSPKTITTSGFTLISITFTPSELISDPNTLDCAPQRIGKLVFYVNGRPFWTIDGFPEFYFHELENDREKQIGVPYTISWGGGSFGLKHSWHYDYQTYIIYNGQDDDYVNSNFSITENPIIGTGLTSGLSLSADTLSFSGGSVMRIEYTGGTGNTYFVKFNNPISIISKRDYVIDASIYDTGIFKSVDSSGNTVTNKISIVGYDVNSNIGIVNDIEYQYPIANPSLAELQSLGLHPYPDQQEYQYIYTNGIMYDGVTGLPIVNENGYLSNHSTYDSSIIGNLNNSYVVSGQDEWKNLKSIIRGEETLGQSFMHLGLLIETSDTLNLNKPLYIKDFTYTAADILVIEEPKTQLIIGMMFDSSFIGGIQKLRLYDRAFNSSEVLHNAIIESRTNPDIVVSKGGRIIYR